MIPLECVASLACGEGRNGLDDCAVVGEGVKGLNQELTFPFFDMDKTHSSKSDSAARIERVNQFVFASTRLQLVVEHPEHIGRYVFQFELRVVRHTSFSFDLFDVLTLEIGDYQSSLLREQLFGGANDFAHHHGTASKGNDVPIAGDINLGRILAAFDGPASEDTE